MKRISSNGWIHTGSDRVLVLLGHNWHEVREFYRELEVKRPHWLEGYDVKLATCGNFRALQGLRVHKYLVTGLAYKHPKFIESLEILQRSQLMSNYRNEEAA